MVLISSVFTHCLPISDCMLYGYLDEGRKALLTRLSDLWMLKIFRWYCCSLQFLVESVEDLQIVLLLLAFLVESLTSPQCCFRISLGWHLHFTLREETIQHWKNRKYSKGNTWHGCGHGCRHGKYRQRRMMNWKGCFSHHPSCLSLHDLQKPYFPLWLPTEADGMQTFQNTFLFRGYLWQNGSTLKSSRCGPCYFTPGDLLRTSH
jgi:hypothetical protein